MKIVMQNILHCHPVHRHGKAFLKLIHYQAVLGLCRFLTLLQLLADRFCIFAIERFLIFILPDRMKVAITLCWVN
jgi:hypothetical protein